MAWTTVECGKCGKEFKVQMYGNLQYREWKIKNWNWLCEDCKAKQREEEAREAAKKSQEMELPELIGSEKQIQWALKIRLQAIDKLEKQIKLQVTDPDVELLIRLGMQEMLKEQKASWWIDNRDAEWDVILVQMIEKVVNSQKTKPADNSSEIEKEVKAEATVRPINAVTGTVAEITYKNDTIEISFPEKREDFRKTVKELSFVWDDVKLLWKRRINKFNGPTKDRMAEVGNRLLLLGIPIRIFDEDIRNAAINADFQPEQTRWIAQNADTGWFSVSWGRNEDFYSEAKRLPGAKYNRDTRSVIVPPESFQEVLDFADMYGFSLSEKAQELVNKARKEKEKSLVVDPVKPKTIDKANPKAKPEPLEVPKEEIIDEELRDYD